MEVCLCDACDQWFITGIPLVIMYICDQDVNAESAISKSAGCTRIGDIFDTGEDRLENDIDQQVRWAK